MVKLSKIWQEIKLLRQYAKEVLSDTEQQRIIIIAFLIAILIFFFIVVIIFSFKVFVYFSVQTRNHPLTINHAYLSLWWVLMTSALAEATLDADSIKSGLSVP